MNTMSKLTLLSAVVLSLVLSLDLMAQPVPGGRGVGKVINNPDGSITHIVRNRAGAEVSRRTIHSRREFGVLSRRPVGRARRILETRIKNRKTGKITRVRTFAEVRGGRRTGNQVTETIYPDGSRETVVRDARKRTVSAPGFAPTAGPVAPAAPKKAAPKPLTAAQAQRNVTLAINFIRNGRAARAVPLLRAAATSRSRAGFRARAILSFLARGGVRGFRLR